MITAPAARTDIPIARPHHIRGLLRLSMGTGALVLTGLLSGCSAAGAPVAAPAGVSTAIAIPSAVPAPDPEMVMVTLSDLGYRASEISMGVRRTVMLMVVNHGARPHELGAAIPLTGLATDDPATPTVAARGADAGASGFSITVGAGQELDVSFTPTTAGSYRMQDGAAMVGALVVG